MCRHRPGQTANLEKFSHAADFRRGILQTFTRAPLWANIRDEIECLMKSIARDSFARTDENG
jgi:hypothetical protein